MKGIFKRMKGKRGSSLIAVMAAMAVLSIVALCAASIALTNYRTTQTYVSQDSYYYSAESGQAQFVSHVNDVAYNFSSTVDNWTEDKVKELYDIISEIEYDLSDTLYNGEYTVKNEIDPNYVVDPVTNSATFTIITTVTSADGSTQEYTSTIKIDNPIGATTVTGEDYVNVKMDVSDPLMNNGYGIVTGGSHKNTTWYGLWGGFNTFQTTKGYKVKNIKDGRTSVTNPYYDTTNTSPLNGVTNAAKFYTLEATPTDKKADFTSTGIWLKKVTKKTDADSPDDTGFTNFFSTNSKSSTSGATQDKLNNFFDKNIDVDVKGIVEAAKKNSQFTKTFENGIELKYSERNDSQRYYAKYDGSKQFFITFDTKPADQAAITLAEWKKQAGIETYEPFYRVTTNSSKSKHDLAYAYTEADGTFKNKTSNQSYTYADHYYKNKWFFIDLEKADGTLGTLHLSNSVTAEKFYDYDKKQFFWVTYYQKSADYTITDGYKIPNYANFGNIVMEDCYFFVNGNIEIANAYNMSNCKVFATGYILLESVYYMEGLLSLETKAGSDTIKQSLYYTDSYFQSNLVSRYAMAWLLDNVSNGVSNWSLLSPTGRDGGSWGSLPEEYNDCAISNACSYTATTTAIVGFMWVTTTSDGYLATYRYPTVLKAVVIAEGKTDFEDYARKNNDRSTTKTTFKDVSIILNPNGSADGVVDAVLIEGQLFSRYKTLTLNHNYASEGSVQTNRYAAASQIQYHPYGDGTADDVFGELNEIIKTELVSTETKPIIIQNSGVMKK